MIGIILAIRNNSREASLLEEQSTVTQQTTDNTVEETHVLLPGEYLVESETSILAWEGRKPLIPNYIDKGTLKIQSGNLSVDIDGVLVAGTATADMQSIIVTETGIRGGLNGLAGDLVSDRFFDVATYPTASFIMKEISEMNRKGEAVIMGDLTIKGISQTVQVPATFSMINNKKIILDADMTFDRTKFSITFGSGNFFSDLGDKVIDDMVPTHIHLEAQMQ